MSNQELREKARKYGTDHHQASDPNILHLLNFLDLEAAYTEGFTQGVQAVLDFMYDRALGEAPQVEDGFKHLLNQPQPTVFNSQPFHYSQDFIGEVSSLLLSETGVKLEEMEPIPTFQGNTPEEVVDHIIQEKMFLRLWKV